MERRKLLAAATAFAVAGCVDVVDTPPDDEEPQGDHDDEVEDRSGDVELTSQDTTPERVNLELEAEVVQGAITEETPPKIQVKATNTGEEPLSVSRGHLLFQPHASGSVEERGPLKLGFEDTPEYDDDDSGCWRIEGIRYFHGADEERGLPSGETTTVIKALGTRVEADDCFPDGRYRFEDSFEVAETEFTWGFEIEINR